MSLRDGLGRGPRRRQSARKLVLMVLADERDDTDLCCPGLERIAAIGEMSTKSAARHIDALAELGKITVYKRGRSHGYILHCPPKADAVSNEAPEPAFATPDGWVHERTLCPKHWTESPPNELWPRVGDGLRGGGGVSWGVTKPPGLQARSDTP